MTHYSTERNDPWVIPTGRRIDPLVIFLGRVRTLGHYSMTRNNPWVIPTGRMIDPMVILLGRVRTPGQTFMKRNNPWINSKGGVISLHYTGVLIGLYWYSKTSMARARIARILDRSNTLADSMFRFFAILNSYYCCVRYFYKPESPEVRIKFVLRAIQTCKNDPHDFEL